MNIFELAGRIPKIIGAAKDLAEKLEELHDDPEFKALIASNAGVKAKSDAISRDARTLTEALR